jgi:hypothetical protein
LWESFEFWFLNSKSEVQTSKIRTPIFSNSYQKFVEKSFWIWRNSSSKLSRFAVSERERERERERDTHTHTHTHTSTESSCSDFGAMVGQVVKSMGSSFSISSTSCFVAAAQRRVLSSKMVTGLGFGSLREMTLGCCWSLSLCNGPRELQMRRRSLGLSREFREKSCTWGVRMFSHTEEPGEGNVTIVEDCEW